MVFLCAAVGDARAQRFPGGSGGSKWPGDRDDPTDPDTKKAAAAKKAQKYYDAGVKLLSEGRVRLAKIKFRAAIEMVGLDEGIGQAAMSQLRDIHAKGMAELERARSLFGEAKYREALELAREVKVVYANIFGGLTTTAGTPNLAPLAAKLIKTIEENPEAKIALQEYEAAKRAKRIPLLESRAKEDRTRYYDLYKLCKTIAKRFPDCPTGKRCADEVQKLRADKKIWKQIKKEKKRRFIASTLASIEQFEKAGLHAEAAKEYRKLTKRFPGKTREQLRKMAEK